MIRTNSLWGKTVERLHTKLIEPFLKMGRGTVIEAQVSRDQEGHPVLHWRGQQFSVDSRIPLPFGQPVKLMYEGTRDGQAMLRLLDTPASEMSAEPPSLSDARPASTREVAQVLRSWGLPASPESVQHVRSLLGDASEPPAGAAVNRTAMLLKSGIPVNRQAVQAWQGLWEAATAPESSPREAPQGKPIPLQPQPQSSGLAGSRPTLTGFADLLRGCAGASLRERLVPLVHLLQQASMPQPDRGEPSAAPARFLAEVYAASSEQGQDAAEVLREFTGMVRRDVAEAVFDAVVQRAMDRAGVAGMYAHVPLLLDGTPYPLQLAAFADEPQPTDEGASSPYTVVLDVQTQSLGSVHAALQTKGDQLRLHFGVDGSEVESWVRESLSELERGLTQDGWSCEIVVRQRQGQTVLQNTVDRIRDQAPPSVDLRV